MPLKYYGDSISRNIIKRPNGGIICKNVPIGRTGDMVYLGRELGIENEPNRKFTVKRLAEDVFAPATLASFEGVAVTDDHPPEHITANNYGLYAKGHVQNVRQGRGRHSDQIVADLFVDDAVLVSKVMNRITREVSCGYGCTYEARDNYFLQKQMCGNHVAIVPSGRAGRSISIQDSKPESITRSERRKPNMGNVRNTDASKIARIIRLAMTSGTNDASPDEIDQIANDAATAIDGLFPEYKAPAEAGTKLAEVTAAAAARDSSFESSVIDTLVSMKNAMDAMAAELREKEKAKERAIGREEEKRRESDDAKADDKDPKIVEKAASTKAEALDTLVETLTGDASKDQAETEEAMTVKAGSMDNMAGASGNASAPAFNADTAAAVIQAIRPSVAAITNDAERRRVIDAIVGAVDPLKMAGADANPISGIMQTTAQHVPLNDSQFSDAELDAYQNMYDSMNPHAAEKKGVAQ